ncbi:MAG TPA: hypothetical protein PLG15_05480 [Candidatus Gastranaerophilaceae bacterium]|nr:hypothetical protein [Candidatus Gastranaerophilaceae bacterium]HPT41816.1 hypothetical protein [Candidatus Gastranaerophilaceae bacterium]
MVSGLDNEEENIRYSEVGIKNVESVDNSAEEKKGFILVKNRNEGIALVVVGILLVCALGYASFTQYSNNSQNVDTSASEALLAEAQQKGLQSLEQTDSAEQIQQDAQDIYSKTLALKGEKAPDNMPSQSQKRVQIPVSQTSSPQTASNNDDVEIVSKKNAGKLLNVDKRVLIQVSESGRQNPFVPTGELSMLSAPKFTLINPPDQLGTGSDADKVMGTTISGILYDRYSPSAIINIGGNDYLVKKGDVINNYRVLGISKDQVVVQLGQNVYKAGVGQLLVQSEINYNTIANLEKKFAGNDVSIKVKKKKK